ncbi:MAG: DnaJ domain-containing protein, partial [Pseudanabaena sp. LacPavin_0818_WC45_MAG_42_6]|nr:DnaJ domain-containing protein [Pseudanabaena sp. LacPavin_0818_WC45_MAG_42_6]
MHLSECYRLLGVPRNATLDDIKVAYRRLARKYHPDINQNDPTATDKFRLVQEAYKMLKDSDKEDLNKELFAKKEAANATRSQPSPPPPKAPNKPPQP